VTRELGHHQTNIELSQQQQQQQHRATSATSVLFHVIRSFVDQSSALLLNYPHCGRRLAGQTRQIRPWKVVTWEQHQIGVVGGDRDHDSVDSAMGESAWSLSSTSERLQRC